MQKNIRKFSKPLIQKVTPILQCIKEPYCFEETTYHGKPNSKSRINMAFSDLAMHVLIHGQINVHLAGHDSSKSPNSKDREGTYMYSKLPLYLLTFQLLGL